MSSDSLTTYRLLHRYTPGFISKYREARDLCAYMLGRRFGEYIVVKSDKKGDRVVSLVKSEGDVTQMEKILNDA